MNTQSHTTRTESGLTLIELLIMMVVLGILASVVVFALGAVTTKPAPSSYLQKDQAILATHKVADAAQVLSVSAGDSSLAPVLILDQEQLTRSTPASSIHFAGQSSTSAYFNIIIRPRSASAPPMHMCLIAAATANTASIKVGQCKVRR